MPALRDNSKYRGDISGYWRQRAERARKLAEQVRQSVKYAPQKLSKQRILKLAKRYDQMANLAEERASRSTTEIFSRSMGPASDVSTRRAVVDLAVKTLVVAGRASMAQ
jgi:hypothetical protein